MIIENPEAFKAWMTTVLEPLCDADPEALAKYVYALIKKDKPTDELRKSMNTQLEVFLQKETKDFVDFLFTKLEAGLTNENTYMIKVKEEPLDDISLKTGTGTGTGDEDELLALENCLLEENTADDPKDVEKNTESFDPGLDMEPEPISHTDVPLPETPDIPIPPAKDQIYLGSRETGDCHRDTATSSALNTNRRVAIDDEYIDVDYSDHEFRVGSTREMKPSGSANAKKRRLTKSETTGSTLENKFNHAYEILQFLASKKKYADDSFGDYVAQSIKKIGDSKLKSWVRQQITDILHQAECAQDNTEPQQMRPLPTNGYCQPSDPHVHTSSSYYDQNEFGQEE